LDDADLVFTLGFDMVEYHPSLWNAQRDKHIVHADFLAAEIDQCYHPEIELVGDLTATLTEFSRLLKTRDYPPFDLTVQQDVRNAMRAELSEYAEDDTAGSIRPQKILWDVREVMGSCDIVLSDVGAHKMWIARHYHCHQPNTCLIPNGYCSMGFALPGAIAGSLVYPDRRILAIAGDGGFLMNVQEMETARRLCSNIVVMVWEDNSYGLIEWKQDTEFKRHTDLSFGNPDWLKLAESFGWQGHLCTQSRQLKTILAQALEESGPSLVVVPVDYRENALLTERLGRIGKRM
jgi:acetolactate synthase-1/2/3 large subunit